MHRLAAARARSRPARARWPSGSGEPERPLLVAGGGVHYSLAEAALRAFAERHGIPVAETQAGKGSLPWDHPACVGAIGVCGSTAANALAADADLVLAVGTRLADFPTGSRALFQGPDLTLVALNVAPARRRQARRRCRWWATRGRGLEELSARLGAWRAPAARMETARRAHRGVDASGRRRHRAAERTSPPPRDRSSAR